MAEKSLNDRFWEWAGPLLGQKILPPLPQTKPRGGMVENGLLGSTIGAPSYPMEEPETLVYGPDFLYGSGFEGIPGANDYAPAYAAANRSALASFGFDPRAHRISDGSIEAASERFGSGLQGFYNPILDEVVTRGEPDYNYFDASTLKHEMVHRGVAQLRNYLEDLRENDESIAKDPHLWAKVTHGLAALDKLEEGGSREYEHDLEELLVRYLDLRDNNIKHWNASAVHDDKMHKNALLRFGQADNKQLFDDLEQIAAWAIAHRRPGGPR